MAEAEPSAPAPPAAASVEAELRAQIDSLSATQLESSRQIEALTQEKATLTEENKGLTSVVGTLRTQVTQRTVAAKKLEEQLQQAQEEAARAKRALEEMKGEKTVTDASATENESSAKPKAPPEEKQEVEEDTRVSREEYDKLKEELRKAHSETNRKIEDMWDWKNKFESLEELHKATEKRLASSQNDHKSEKRVNEELSAKLKEAETLAAERLREIAGRDETIESLTKQLSVLNSLETDRAKVNEAIARVSGAQGAKTVEELAVVLRHDNSCLADENVALKGMLDGLMQEFLELRNSTVASAQQLQAMQSQVQTERLERQEIIAQRCLELEAQFGQALVAKEEELETCKRNLALLEGTLQQAREQSSSYLSNHHFHHHDDPVSHHQHHQALGSWSPSAGGGGATAASSAPYDYSNPYQGRGRGPSTGSVSSSIGRRPIAPEMKAAILGDL